MYGDQRLLCKSQARSEFQGIIDKRLLLLQKYKIPSHTLEEVRAMANAKKDVSLRREVFPDELYTAEECGNIMLEREESLRQKKGQEIDFREEVRYGLHSRELTDLLSSKHFEQGLAFLRYEDAWFADFKLACAAHLSTMTPNNLDYFSMCQVVDAERFGEVKNIVYAANETYFRELIENLHYEAWLKHQSDPRSREYRSLFSHISYIGQDIKVY